MLRVAAVGLLAFSVVLGLASIVLANDALVRVWFTLMT